MARSGGIMSINNKGVNVVNKIKFVLKWITVSTILLSISVLMSCGNSDESELTHNQQISAEVCIEGSGRDAVLFVRNLNDFSWDEVSMEVVRGGRNYILGVHAAHVVQNRWTKLTIEPEITKAAEPFTEPNKFTSRKESHRELLRLTSFDLVQSVTLILDKPFESKWTSDVGNCE